MSDGSSNNDSNNTPNKSQEDDELSRLLDSSLHEFGKSNLEPSMNDDFASSSGIPPVVDDEFDTEAARKAASEFTNMLQQLTEVQKAFMQQMSSDSATGSALGNNKPLSDSSSSDQSPKTAEQQQEDMQFAQTFVKSMEYLTGKAQKIQDAKTDEQFTEAMQQLSNDEFYDDNFLPFMQGMMGSLLSKDMLYPPMKDMCDKFPKWLTDNKSKLDDASIANYEQQIKLMQEICAEFENESVVDSEKEQSERFDRLVANLQKMQACGHPPEELIGTLPPGWRFDSQSGLPQVVEPEKAAEACCIM